MRSPRKASAAVLAVAGIAAWSATPLPAQNPWVASYYPYLLKGPNEKLSFVVHYQFAQLADWDQRVPYSGSLSADAGINPDGGRWVVGRFKGPLLVAGWRFHAEAGAVREARQGYFGLGNDTEPADDPAGRHYDRLRRTRYGARVEATRRVVGPFAVALGGGLADASFSALPGGSRFRDECAPPQGPAPLDAGDLPSAAGECANAVDLLGRVALVLDTRDDEFTPAQGVLLEGGVLAGSGGDGYTGFYGLAQGFVTPREGTVLAARVLGRHLDDGAPLDARYGLVAWERTIELVGGPESHRSFVSGRFLGRDVLLANVEVRQDVLNFGDYGAITALGFFDAASARERGSANESKDLHAGGGVGLALRILRATILTFNWAWGGDGYQFSMGTGWMF